jgi:hypothetical protein
VTLNMARPRRTSSSNLTCPTLSLAPLTHMPAHRLLPSLSFPGESVWNPNRTGCVGHRRGPLLARRYAS